MKGPWLDKEGNALSCAEKVRVLTENEAELAGMLREYWEDALTLDVGEDFMRRRLQALVAECTGDPNRQAGENST
ncbi:hypothetical protein E3E12_03930 [Formicincola oecophyllae]|uniref:Uncharacterized protein n=1 Tax=Formicincola oecophyllae TaxID=2558361 RepID=A0A4Y6UA84_9PROT|nr:hypothetical protein [Formicincola oecophyllae]QDH13488.1 hypothetical protein E3E12_03930 [Formicincola oecophyllae]